MSVGGAAVAAAYDAIAPDYDLQLEDDSWMRHFLWTQYSNAFRPGHHVLDVGCGTGTDAIYLGLRGVRVTAIDISPAMIAETERKIARCGLANVVRAATQDIGELACLPPTEFDGVISSFGALNTLPALSQFAADAARLLRPEGRVFLHLLNGSSLWEWAGLMAHREWARAQQLKGRRAWIFNVGGQPVQHYLPRVDDVYARNFAPYFGLCRACGLGIVRPPRPIGHIPDVVLGALAQLDLLVGSHHPLIDWGRFVMLEMRRAG